MSEQKCISTNETNPPRASSTKSPTKTEPVIEGPTFSYYWWVSWAVAITAVILGVYYFYPKAGSSSPQVVGLVFYMETIAVQLADLGLFEDQNVCERAVGGKDRAEMLKTQIERISKTKELFIIEDHPSRSVLDTEYTIKLCMQDLKVWKYFKGMYVWESKDEDKLSEIIKVIKETGLDRAKLRFISRFGEKSQFLRNNNFKVIEVNREIKESDFQKLI